MSKEQFKIFAKNHPELVQSISSGAMTWQKYYEIYDMYGEDPHVWQPYLEPVTAIPSAKAPKKDASLQELLGMVKSIDLETVQKGINGIQKAIGLVQDLGLGSKREAPTNNYQPRPIHKYYED